MGYDAVGTVKSLLINDGGMIPLHNAVPQQMMPDFAAVEGIVKNLGDALLAYVPSVQAETASDFRLGKQFIGLHVKGLGNELPFFVNHQLMLLACRPVNLIS